METTKLILEITNKLHEYIDNRTEMAPLLKDDKDNQNFLLGELSGFYIAMDIVAEVSKNNDISVEELIRVIRKKAILGV